MPFLSRRPLFGTSDADELVRSWKGAPGRWNYCGRFLPDRIHIVGFVLKTARPATIRRALSLMMIHGGMVLMGWHHNEDICQYLQNHAGQDGGTLGLKPLSYLVTTCLESEQLTLFVVLWTKGIICWHWFCLLQLAGKPNNHKNVILSLHQHFSV